MNGNKQPLQLHNICVYTLCYCILIAFHNSKVYGPVQIVFGTIIFNDNA